MPCTSTSIESIDLTVADMVAELKLDWCLTSAEYAEVGIIFHVPSTLPPTKRTTTIPSVVGEKSIFNLGARSYLPGQLRMAKGLWHGVFTYKKGRNIWSNISHAARQALRSESV